MSEFSPHIAKRMTQKLVRYIKITFYSLLGLIILLIVGGGIFSYVYKDKIITYFLTKANDRLVVPVDVEKIDISIFQKFPYTSIVLENISIKSSGDYDSEYLAEISKAYFTLNPFKVVRGKYEIDECIIEDGTVNLEIDEEGNANYHIVRKKESLAQPVESVIKLDTRGVNVNYLDRRSQKVLGFFLQKVNATIDILGKKYKTAIHGDLMVSHITLNELTYFKEKEVQIDALLNIDDEMKFLTIEEGLLGIGNGNFEVNGDVAYDSPLKVDLQVKGVKTNAQTLLSLLPDDYSRPLRGYRSKGEIYFEGTVSGEFTDSHNPNSILKFGANNAEFYHPNYKKSVRSIYLTGELETGTNREFSLAQIRVRDMQFDLDGNVLKGYLDVKNFKNPYINAALQGRLNLDAFSQSFPDAKIEKAYGNADIDIHLSGYPNSGSLNSFKADGEVDLHNVSFIVKGERLPFNTFNGSFMFRNNDLAISNFSGSVGKSDFLVNGFFKNITSFFKKENKHIKIEADLQAKYLDFDELLMSNFASQDTVKNDGHKYNFSISPDIDLDFNCDVDKLKFRRFYSSDVSGNLNVINSIARLNNLSLQTMGGNLHVDASVNNKLKSVVEISCDAALDGIYVDSIFYVFHNFDQGWLIDKNLRGQLDADVNTYILLDDHLKFYSDDFDATIGVSIKNGELLDFEPMQKLSRFVEEESLAHLKFSEVRNEIVIKNKTIFIPKMLVSSSVSNIQLSGTHHFDQRINYHVAIPLRSFLRLRRLTEREIEQRSNGSHLLLKIFGTTSDYEIKYDTEAVKQKIKEDIREEGQELKEIFKNKGKTEEEVIVVEEDEYFNFDEDQ